MVRASAGYVGLWKRLVSRTQNQIANVPAEHSSDDKECSHRGESDHRCEILKQRGERLKFDHDRLEELIRKMFGPMGNSNPLAFVR
jgi:hypothetical protein